MTYFKDRKNAFGFAFSGLRQAFKTEKHLKIHFLCAVMVIAAGFYFSVSALEWVAVLTCIALVFAFELINSAIEKLCDLVIPHQHPGIKYIKDVSAGAVLVVCILAVLTGILIFIPYLR
jgi:diacylglycerol kinase